MGESVCRQASSGRGDGELDLGPSAVAFVGESSGAGTLEAPT